NIYWTDQQLDVIEVARVDGSYRYVIDTTGLDKPRSIVVHPVQGLLFWVDWGVAPKIERSRLDGSERQSIVSEDIGWPNGLTIDYENDYLYWCDARTDKIERVKFDGSDRKEIISASYLQDPFAITVFNKSVYWTDRTKDGGGIYRAQKNDGSILQVVRQGLGMKIKDIHIYNTQRQQGTNLCSESNNNGGCEQLCFYLGNNKRKCTCAHGKLAEDGVSCEDFDAFLLYSERTIIKSIHLYDDSNPNQPYPAIEDEENIRNVIGLTFDSTEMRIYYTDIQKGNIQTVHYDGTGHRVIVS
ncbi:low-density lipoprotein receptor-related protein 1-like, partial [Saccoglossus kowalevskii]